MSLLLSRLSEVSQRIRLYSSFGCMDMFSEVFSCTLVFTLTLISPSSIHSAQLQLQTQPHQHPNTLIHTYYSSSSSSSSPRAASAVASAYPCLSIFSTLYLQPHLHPHSHPHPKLTLILAQPSHSTHSYPYTHPHHPRCYKELSNITSRRQFSSLCLPPSSFSPTPTSSTHPSFVSLPLHLHPHLYSRFIHIPRLHRSRHVVQIFIRVKSGAPCTTIT